MSVKTKTLTQFYQPDSRFLGSRRTAIIKKKEKKDKGEMGGRE